MAPRRQMLPLLAVLLLAAALRVPDFAAAAGSGDEATVVERAALALDGRLQPPAFDWPPGSSFLLAGIVALLRPMGMDLATDPARLYTAARVLFAIVAVAAVALTGVLGAALADDRRQAPWTAAGAALALAVCFVSVRLSRAAHPEHLQMALVLLGLLAGLRSGRTRWLLAAGAAAGLAGAVKYLGITVVAVPVMAVFTQPALSWSRRLGRSALVMLVAGLTFAAGTLGTAVRGTAFLRGFADQLAHQSAGHLGYEAEGPGWLFHATTSLPGSWGWPLTIAAAAGVVLVALRGTRAQRLTAAYAAGLYGLVGMSRIAFPHYVLVVTPLLAALACVALARLAAALPRQVAVAAIALVIASLVPSLGNDLRLRRLDDAPRTTELAGVAAAGLPGPVWSDHSTGVAEPARTMFSLSERAEETLGCDCYAVLSSLQEERYRRLPRRYAREVAGYDALREAGTVVAVVEPSLPLSYRWDVLPQWGLARIPLRGPLPTVGPTVTILDLRAPGRLARQTGAAAR